MKEFRVNSDHNLILVRYESVGKKTSVKYCDNFIIFPLIFCTNYLSLKIPSAILFSFATEWV